VIVTAAPDIIFLQDTDGDGRADVRRVLFTGFSTRRSSEGRVTNLRFAPDNWIYVANNGAEGTITSPEYPNVPGVSVLGSDFRFRLDRGMFEAESGQTQFGHGLDDWGHRFVSNNSIHVRHVVLPRRYLNRNPFLAVADVMVDVSDHGSRLFQLSEPQFWRRARTAMRKRRYQELELHRNEEVSGAFTGGAGGTVYSGDAFPAEYRGNLFTGDVACNLVHRDVLEPQGATYVARRGAGETEREFLTSTDPWFRPCNLATGPDGSLYVVDMYREVIEGPEFIPEELKKDFDFYSGSDRGRIYRIVQAGTPPAPARPFDLRRAAPEELVRLLAHPNGWWRLTAQRLLLERQDRAAVPLLSRLAAEGESGQARLHALYALEGLGALDAAAVRRALKDPVSGVREHALSLAERFPDLVPDAAPLVDDPAGRVAFQAVLSLGAAPLAEALRALASAASRHAGDRWFRYAVLTSRRGSSPELVRALGADFRARNPADAASFVSELAAVIGARSDAGELRQWLDLLAPGAPLDDEACRTAALSGLARGLRTAGAERIQLPGADAAFGRLIGGGSEKVEAAALSAARFFDLPSLVALSRRVALDGTAPPGRRRNAVLSLAAGRFEDVRPLLETLLDGAPVPEVTGAVFVALGSFDSPGVPQLLLARWKKLGPDERRHAADVLLGRRGFVPALLDAVETGAVERAALELPAREKLLRNPDADIAARARRVLREQPSDRDQVVASYRPALDLRGDSAHGRALFDKNCATCHLTRGGRLVGPDLARVRGKTKLELLEAILAPSRAIEPVFTNYVILTRDGRIHDGLIAAETVGTLTVRRGDEDETILRANISEIRASGVSLMPDGFEATLGRQDLADVIAFLQGANLRQP
jgi:putative membrane-bound dehydrogenase-like protein